MVNSVGVKRRVGESRPRKKVAPSENLTTSKTLSRGNGLICHLLPGPVLDVALAGVVQDEVHVLVEADDAAFHPGVDVLVEPDGDEGPVLEVAEDQVDRLDHHPLDFGVALVSHREDVRRKEETFLIRRRPISKNLDRKYLLEKVGSKLSPSPSASKFQPILNITVVLENSACECLFSFLNTIQLSFCA